MKGKQLDEKVTTGGGATGMSQGPDTVAKSATLPKSNHGNGDAMRKIDDPNNPGVEETDAANNTKPTGDKSAPNKASVSMKPSGATPGQSHSFTPNDKSNTVREDVEALFNGEELTEEFKEKASAIFEAAVSLRVAEQTAALEEELQQSLTEQQEEYEKELAEQVDSYLDYIVEHWLQENEVALESSLRTEITDEFINRLRGVFEESYISVPEEKIDALGEMATKVDEIQEQLDAAMNENVLLKRQIGEEVREKILTNVAEGLTATQAEKLVALAEGVDFDDMVSFEKKLKIVKENYFPSSKEVKSLTDEMITEEAGNDAGLSKPARGPMANYVSAISRTLKK